MSFLVPQKSSAKGQGTGQIIRVETALSKGLTCRPALAPVHPLAPLNGFLHLYSFS